MCDNFQSSLLTQQEFEELSKASFIISNKSIKMSLDGVIVGYFALVEKPINFKIRKRIDSPNICKYKEKMNRKQNFYIRKIWFQQKYLFSGQLENLWGDMIKQLPSDSLLWCHLKVGNIEKYITQLNCFNPPECPVNSSIQICLPY